MANSEQCGVKGCDQAPGASLEGDPLCRAHFISVSYEQLERYDEMQKAHRLSLADAESVRRSSHHSLGQRTGPSFAAESQEGGLHPRAPLL